MGSRRAPVVVLALFAGALVLASCSGSPSALSNTTTTTTTTTTTLPRAGALSGTFPQGAYASLGPIERVSVPILTEGELGPLPGQFLHSYSPGTVKIAFRQFGSGPPLLLVMGEHATMTWWDPQLLEALAASFTVTIFDLPGVGYSATLPGTASASTSVSCPSSKSDDCIEGYADATAGLIYALGLVQPAVLGWGIGGAVALSLVERHHGIASRLVLVDATSGGPKALPTPRGVASELDSTTLTPGALSHLVFVTSDDALRAAWLARILELSPDDIVASAITLQGAVVAKLDRDASIARGLPVVHLPALVIAGEEDAIIPAANSAELASGLGTHHFIEVPNAGYEVLVEDETALLPAIVKFAAIPTTTTTTTTTTSSTPPGT